MRPLSCQFKGCGHVAGDKYRLKTHMRVHSEERPFACSKKDCPKRFKSTNDRKVHEESTHGPRQYKCGHCERRFTRNSSLHRHHKSAHPNLDLSLVTATDLADNLRAAPHQFETVAGGASLQKIEESRYLGSNSTSTAPVQAWRSVPANIPLSALWSDPCPSRSEIISATRNRNAAVLSATGIHHEQLRQRTISENFGAGSQWSDSWGKSIESTNSTLSHLPPPSQVSRLSELKRSRWSASFSPSTTDHTCKTSASASRIEIVGNRKDLDMDSVNHLNTDGNGEGVLPAISSLSNTAISSAAGMKRRYLIQNPGHTEYSALHLAARFLRARRIEASLRSGCQIDDLAANGRTALHTVCACAADRDLDDVMSCVRVLLKAGIHINHQDQDGNTALHLLFGQYCFRNDAEVVGQRVFNLLYREGAHICLPNNRGRKVDDLLPLIRFS